MKIKNLFLLLGIVIYCISCGGNPSGSSISTEESNVESADTIISREAPADYFNNTNIPNHKCNLAGEILANNQYWYQEFETLVCIVADSTTYDKALGINSHRIFEIYDTKSCTRNARITLPVNESPDFPYYLAKINYNNAFRLIAIRGFNNIYIYDLESKKMWPPLIPAFKEERFASDAQSGRIIRIEVWEDYLIGYSQDLGAFAFDLSDKSKPKPALPFSEWLSPEEEYQSLFLLTSAEGGIQAFIPGYNFETNEFSTNPIFPKPQEINTKNAGGVSKSQYVVFRGKSANGAAIVIDLQSKKLVELPQNISQGNNKAILDWLKANK